MVLESRPALEEQLLPIFKHSAEWPKYDYDSDWPKEEWCNKCNAARIFEKLVWDPLVRVPNLYFGSRLGAQYPKNSKIFL